MDVRIDASWKQALASEWQQPYFEQLTQFVRQEYATKQIFPPGRQIFAAFDATPFDQVKVVILGQDPYHGPGQANGLCFSVNDGIPYPPSLVNIFKEVHDDTGAPIPTSGDLMRWARQGVLMLNATLTVQAHMAGSHQGKGWEQFTDAAIAALATQRRGLVFMLWGNYAKQKGLVGAAPLAKQVREAVHQYFGTSFFTILQEQILSSLLRAAILRIPETPRQ